MGELVSEGDRIHIKKIDTTYSQFILSLLNTDKWIQNIGDRNIHSLTDAESYITNNMVQKYHDHGYGMYVVTLKEQSALAIGFSE